MPAASTSAAVLHTADIGQAGRARAVPAPVLKGFIEGFEMADLMDAKVLPDERA